MWSSFSAYSPTRPRATKRLLATLCRSAYGRFGDGASRVLYALQPSSWRASRQADWGFPAYGAWSAEARRNGLDPFRWTVS